MVDVEQNDTDPWIAYRENHPDLAVQGESIGDQSLHGKYQEQGVWQMDITDPDSEYEELTRKEIYKRRIDKSKSRLKKAG